MPHAIYIVDESEEAPPSAFTRESPHRHTLTSTHHNAPHSYERQLSWDGDQSYGRAINRIKLEVGAASPREAVEGWGGADCGPGGTTLTPQDVSTDGAVVQADDAAGDIPAESGAQDNTCSNTHAKNRAQDNTHGTTHDDNTLHAKAMPVTDHTRVYLGVGTNHTSMTHIKIEPEPHPATSEQAHEGAEVRAKLDVGGSTAHGGGVKQEQDRPLTTDRGQRDGTHDRTDSGGGETVPERKTYAIDKDSAGGAVGLAGAQPLAKRTATTIRLSKETGQDQSDKERKRQRALRFNMDRKPSPSSHRTGPGAGAGAGPMDLVPQAEGEERRERDMRNHGNETPGNHGDNDRRRHGEREHPDLADDNLDQRIAELEKEMALRAKSRSVMSRSDSRSELQRRRSQSSAQRDMSLQTRHGDRGDERGRDRERDRERDRDKDRDRDTARDRDDDRPAHSQHSSGVAGKRRLSQTERRGGEAYDRNDRDSSERRGRDSHARTDRHAHTHRSSRSSTRGISPAHARGASRSRTVSHTFNDGRRNSKHGARSVGSHTDEPTHAQADPRNSDQLVFKAAPMLSGSSHSSGGEEEDRRGSDNERGVGVSGYTMTVALKGEPFPVRLPSQTTSHAHTHPHKRLRRDSTVVADVHAQPSGGTRKGKGTPYTTKAHDSYDPDSTHMTAPAPADAPTGAHGLTLGGVCAAMCTAADAQGPNATDDDVIADTPAVLYTACPAFLQNTCVSAMCTRPHPPPCVMPYMATVLGLNKEGATARAVLDMLVQSVKVGIAVTIQACPYLSNGRACISTPCRYYHPEDRVTRKQPLIETGSGSHDNGDNVQQIACAHTTADKETDQAPASSAPAMAGRSQTSMNDTTNDRATATTQQHPAQLQTHTAHTQAQPTQATTAQGHPPQQHTVSNVHMDSKRDSDVARMVLPHSEAKARQYTRWSTQTDKPGFSQPVKTEFTHPKVDTYPSPRRSSLSNYQAHVDTLRPPQDPRQNTATQPQQHPEEAKQPIQRSNTNTHTHQHSEVSRQSSLQRSNTHTHTQQSPQTQIPPQERRSEERARYAQGHTAQPRDYLKQARDYRDSSGDPKDGPLLRREERSINSRDDRSINNREDHINSRDDRIINSREDRINSRDDRYISSREDRAINSRGDRSINSRENRAINNGEQGAKPRPLLDNPPARYRDNQRYHRFSNETNPDFDKNLEFTPKRPRIEADLNPSDPFTAPQSGQRFHMSPNPTQEHSPSCEARGLSADRAPYRQDDRAPAPGHVQDRAGGSSNDCRGELAPNFSTTDWRVREHSAERGRARTRDRSRPPPSPGDLRSRLKSPNATYRS
ncbi:hypothetical protein SARC_12848 [Sphaeroforma arctica JP610]|uniref:C3H1-type domain-containing protein n=1 Tax=Sphaeroforma arctica JP610 TaxID=667725 RepID=A0A0L0FCZ7_9EUKA|nr:hypothetical protein SARC_12848 [Sphaeroforma arctica JP610]KNC74610.1 hypothetical protein SARC_12848 [Sphaeroforma arctica JP610]|eukprot:XP_014148512.1 hypothetical protein SARC_12848 [Sphaeroforma arctica JP610]